MASKFIWLLDNGHGVDTPGKRSPILPDGRQFFEYEFNRAIIKRLMALLDQAKISYMQIVPEDHDVSVADRVKRANAFLSTKPKIYLSVHSNADNEEWSAPRGIESYCYRYYSKSERLAKTFQSALTTQVGWVDRGVKIANFYVLKYTQMPAVLTENGFYTNQEECIRLLDNEWRDRIAYAHYLAIKELEATGYNF